MASVEDGIYMVRGCLLLNPPTPPPPPVFEPETEIRREGKWCAIKSRMVYRMFELKHSVCVCVSELHDSRQQQAFRQLTLLQLSSFCFVRRVCYGFLHHSILQRYSLANTARRNGWLTSRKQAPSLHLASPLSINGNTRWGGSSLYHPRTRVGTCGAGADPSVAFKTLTTTDVSPTDNSRWISHLG